MKKVLVTAIGSFSADIVIKTLKKNGYYVIGCDIYPKEWIADAYNVDRFYQAPKAKSDTYIPFLLDICDKESIDYIFPLTDIEIDNLNENRNRFEKKNIVICFSSKKTIDICRNKKEIEKFLKDKGINITIPTRLLNHVDLKKYNYFPAICKPVDGRSSEGLYMIDNREELNHIIKYIDITKYIIQPYISGDIITVDVVRNMSTNKSCAIARKELLRTKNGAGTSVYVFNDKKIEKVACEIAELLNINGCVNFEFIKNNDRIYFIECNPRFSGGVEFSCLAGYDMIINHIKCFQCIDIDSKKYINNQFIARKYEEYITKIEKVNE